ITRIGEEFWQTTSTQAEPAGTFDNKRLNFKVENLPANYLLEILSKELGSGYEVDECGERPVTVVGVNMPLPEVLSSLASQTGTLVSYENNHIRLSCDQPYLKIYTLDYLALERQMTDESRLDSNLDQRTTHSQTRSGNQSNFKLSNFQTHHVWKQLVSQIEALIDQERSIELTHKERRIREDKKRDYTNNRGLKSASDQDNDKTDVTITRKQTLSGHVIAHPESATLAVTATHRQHGSISQWLSTVEKRLTQQVAVDAIIAEVTLSQNYAKGIDWTALQRNGVQLGLAVQGIDIPTPAFSISAAQAGSQFDTSLLIRLLEEFGETSVLSSPRIVALNQQAAVLKLIDNRVFFTTEVQTTAPTSSSSAFSTFNTEIQTVPVGFLMTVTPLVTRDRSIQLRVRPTVTRILGFVPDPNPALAQSNVISQVPEIQTRELESILQLRDGELALLGGLKQTSIQSRNSGIPGAHSAFASSLTSSETQAETHSELVVLLRAKILDNSTRPSAVKSNPQTPLDRLLEKSYELQSHSVSYARRFLELALAEHPYSPEIALNLSILAHRENQPEQARQWLSKAQDRCPKPNCTLPLLGWQALIEAGRDDEQ
ncbi:MAG: hypothetical protein R3194_06695, partial [Limnobacter sp.]|nr:hypothetical protein [Limnobacter sp.]